MNNAVINMGTHILCESLLSVILSVYPEVKLLDHLAILLLIFRETAMPSLSFIAALRFDIPTAVNKGFNSSTSYPTLVFCVWHCLFVLMIAVILMGMR